MSGSHTKSLHYLLLKSTFLELSKFVSSLYLSTSLHYVASCVNIASYIDKSNIFVTGFWKTD